MKTKTKLALLAGGAALAGYLLSRTRYWTGFAGRVVLITGGSRGLGLLLARGFAARGARVAICARDARELQAAIDDLEARDAAAFGYPCDITDPEQVRELVRAVTENLGPIDVLVNNAGVVQVGPVDTMTIHDYELAMRTHYWGPLNAILEVLPGMKRRGDGRIVNIASIGGKVSFPHLLPYSASKFALVGLSEGLRAELSKEGVYVTTVCPWFIRTGSPVHALFKGRNELEYSWFSVGDSLPLVSMDAGRAAARIIEACRRGEAELVLSLKGKLASALHGALPGTTANLLGWLNRILPGPGGIGTEARRGSESETVVSASMLTALGRKAAVENNEVDEG